MKKPIVQLAYRDGLFTKLKNYVEQHKIAGKKLALLLIKMDSFRRLNTIFGYHTGDAFLKAFSHRLENIARSKDFIAHIGNSEFVMLLPEIFNTGHAELAVHKIFAAMEEPFEMDGKSHKIGVHIGISIYPDHDDELESLMQKAELAMMASRTSTASYALYSNEDKDTSIGAWDIEGELESALENDDFELYYQPQVSMQTGCMFGAEALIRWNHKQRGFIRPDIFILIAEKTGQIHAITRWCLNTALRQIKEWPALSEPLSLSVNISALVFNDLSFVDAVKNAINFWGVPAEQLTLEVTESALIDDVSTSFVTLNELRHLGVGISIDDFGTGYSSMAYLKNIPANELKVDQSFIFNMLDNDMDQHIVNTVIEMGHGFNMKVVAEGIENAETFEALKKSGCDIAQGYHVAYPMPLDKFIQWVNNTID